MTEPQNETLEVSGATLSYDVSGGDAPAVVCLHGAGLSRASEDTAEYFNWSSPLKDAGRQIVRYDARPRPLHRPGATGGLHLVAAPR